MSRAGREDDLKAGEGTYTAVLEDYKTNGTIVQFYARAETQDGETLTRPRRGPDAPAMYIVDDQSIPTDLRSERFIVALRDRRASESGNVPEFAHRFPPLSNRYFNATFISNEEEIFYGARIRGTGSPFSRDGDLSRAKWKLPPDRPFRGRTKFSYDDDNTYHNRVARYLLYLLGQPISENEWVRLKVNTWGPYVREEVEPVGKEFLKRTFGEEGDLYRIDDDWWFTDDWRRGSREASWEYKGSEDAGRYRTEWMKRSHETADDFAPLIDLFRTLSADRYSESEIAKLIDPVAVAQYAAVRGYLGDWDSFTVNRGKNGFFYRRAADGRFQFLHWDGDHAFSRGQPLYGDRVRSWLEKPYHRRLFDHYVSVLVTMCGESDRIKAWLKAEEEASDAYSPDAGFYLEWFKIRNRELK